MASGRGENSENRTAELMPTLRSFQTSSVMSDIGGEMTITPQLTLVPGNLLSNALKCKGAKLGRSLTFHIL